MKGRRRRVFKERFKMIYEAVKAKYPEITIIGTVGPDPDGADYDEGWKIARELNLDMVDEHGYREPDWFWENLHRFDAYDRTASTVYVGEYAAHDLGRKNTLRSALAEAAYMTSLECNGDVVRLASCAGYRRRAVSSGKGSSRGHSAGSAALGGRRPVSRADDAGRDANWRGRRRAPRPRTVFRRADRSPRGGYHRANGDLYRHQR